MLSHPAAMCCRQYSMTWHLIKAVDGCPVKRRAIFIGPSINLDASSRQQRHCLRSRQHNVSTIIRFDAHRQVFSWHFLHIADEKFQQATVATVCTSGKSVLAAQ